METLNNVINSCTLFCVAEKKPVVIYFMYYVSMLTLISHIGQFSSYDLRHNKCVKKDLMGVVLKQYPENIAVKTKVSVHLYLKVL